MSQQSNVSYLVLGFFFFGFCLFLLFGTNSRDLYDVTGLATAQLQGFSIDLNPVADTPSGSSVVGNFTLHFKQSATAIPENWYFVLSWKDQQRNKTMQDLASLQSDAFVLENGVYTRKSGYVSYQFGLSVFSLVLSEKETHDLTLALYDTDGKKKTDISVSLGVVTGFNPLQEVRWYVDQQDTHLKKVSVGDVVWCDAVFPDLSVLKQVTVKGFVYAPQSSLDSPTFSVDLPSYSAKIPELLDPSSYRFCSSLDTGEHLCTFTYVMKESTLGQWSCGYRVTLKGQSVTKYSHTSLLMHNSPPELLDSLPELLYVSSSGVLDKPFDLGDYFDDPDGDTISYSLVNATGVFTGDTLKRIEGTGVSAIRIVASDGSSSYESEVISLSTIVTSVVGKSASSATTATCAPQWQYTTWGLCENGVQFRDAVDLKNCGTDAGKQATVQSCVTGAETIVTANGTQAPSVTGAVDVSTGGLSAGSLLIVTFLLAILCAGGIYFVYKLKKKDSVIEKKDVSVAKDSSEKTSPVTQPVTSRPVVQQQPHPLLPLQTHVRSMLAKGFSEEKIRHAVMQAGWKQKDVDTVFTLARLTSFVTQNRKQGVSDAVLRAQLLQKGWKPDVVTDALKL